MPTCKCGADIEFVEMIKSGRRMPYRPGSSQVRLVLFDKGGLLRGKMVNTYESHFADCPEADNFRKDPP